MPKKQSKTNFQRFIERRSRQKERKMTREQQQSNIFDTDPSLLTNEQNFIIDMHNLFLKYNPASIRQLAKAQYSETYGLNMVEEINKNKSWKSWIQGYFDSLWNCLRIFNLKHFYTDYMVAELSDLSYLDDGKDTEKPNLTLIEVFNHINEITPKYAPIDIYSLIYNCIELYFKNKPCKAHQSGNQSGGSLVGGIILILIILSVIFAPASKPSEKKKSKDEPEEEDPSLLQFAADAYVSYKIAQGLLKPRDRY